MATTPPPGRARLGQVGAGEEGATVLAVVAWLGVPVLLAAALAKAGHRIPGDVLPVVAFLPLVLAAYVVATRVPARLRAATVGGPGLVASVALLAFVGADPGPGAALTSGVALLAAVACALVALVAGRAIPRAAPLATAAGSAMLLSQGLDGWQTYLAVANPFGWLPEPIVERVTLSRAILDAAPALFPALKLALAVGLALGIRPGRVAPTPFVAMVLVVCYAGLSPALYSAANILGL